jgi:hypothetical protein
MKNLFKDASGKLSSKRVFGAAGFVAALGLAVYGIIVGAEVAIQMVYGFLGFAGAALGLGAFELERRK